MRDRPEREVHHIFAMEGTWRTEPEHCWRRDQRPPGRFFGLDLDAWRATQRLNLESAFAASRAAWKVMRRARSGSIVNMASLAAHGPGGWMGADYAGSKAGLVRLTRSLAQEAARFGVRLPAQA